MIAAVLLSGYMRCAIVALALLGSTALALGACRGRDRRPKAVTPPGTKGVKPLESRFNPNQPWAFVLPQLPPVEGVAGVRAEQCGTCHRQHYKEWSQSTHGSALRDLQYQAELHKKESPKWLCLNCHTPVQNQRPYRVIGLRHGDVMKPVTKPNPDFDARMRKEAITCATCHVRKTGAGRSVIIGPFGNPESPHPVRKDRKFLRNMCDRCHDPRGERITPLLVCWFKTREELSKGPYGGKKNCVDCHMPRTKRLLAADFATYPIRPSRHHHWVGGGVPKSFAAYDGLLARGYRTGLDVSLEKWRVRPNQKALELTVALTNARAGHWLPTGDPERFIRVLAWLRDSKAPKKRLAVSRHRIGQIWKWVPRAEKIGDNRLKPKERRTWTGKLALPPGKKLETLELVLTVLHVRLTTENAKHMRQAKVQEDLVPGLRKLLRRMERHYPMASYLHHEVVHLGTNARRKETPKELIARSKKERDKPLDERDY